MTTFKQFKAEAFKDKEFKRAYDELDIEFQIVRKIIQKRIDEGLTQAELAKQVGTKQSALLVLRQAPVIQLSILSNDSRELSICAFP